MKQLFFFTFSFDILIIIIIFEEIEKRNRE